MSFTWFLFEMAGTIAFAFSGVLVGLYKRMDIFGITVLSVMTAVGGGMIRDVLCGITPPSVLRSPLGLMVSVATALLLSFFYARISISRKGKRIIAYVYNISDTIGLAAFTVTGALTAIYTFPRAHMVLPVMMGLITAVGGGMLRDILARRMPSVLYMDVYAIASLAGALVLCLAQEIVPLPVASWIGFFVVLLLRFLAIHFGWQLYHPHRPGHFSISRHSPAKP